MALPQHRQRQKHDKHGELELPSREHGGDEVTLDRGKSAPSEKDKTRKVVSIGGPESISPLILGNNKSIDDFSLDRAPKQHVARVGKRMSGRLSTPELKAARPSVSDVPAQAEPTEDDAASSGHHHHHHRVKHVIDDVAAWIHAERERHRARKAARKAKASSRKAEVSRERTRDSSTRRDRSESADSSASSTAGALQKLEEIIRTSSSSRYIDKIPSRKSSIPSRRLGSFRKLRRQSTVSSDTEFDIDQLVPSCEVVLDNSKTVAYLDGEFSPSLDLTANRAATRDKNAWLTFKYEILRLTHTLKFKGWRYVPLEKSGEIDVQRISGCTTNAVYVVSASSDLPQRPTEEGDSTQPNTPRQPPAKLLLRIYGPQVGHLIDREVELQILRRLARKRIGPRLLGTFLNGRFEEYFHARALTPQDLRHPDTSGHIAKRMRELHDGIELLEEERDAGPFVWRNWDKWVDRCEKIATYMDEQMRQERQKASSADALKSKRYGFVCGTEWNLFRKTVERYRKQLNDEYGGPDEIREQLIFAHNDTQANNILRMEPPIPSKLLLPANRHKQLIVIDFEYANANLRGYEFANHFAEWCYDYTDPSEAYFCNPALYPTHEEQYHFVHAYMLHQPEYAPATQSTPRLLPQENLVASPNPVASPSQSSASKSAPELNASYSSATGHQRMPQNVQESGTKNNNSYFPPSSAINAERTERMNSASVASPEIIDEEANTAEKVAALLREAHLWRLVNHAQWVAWGVVQAKPPGFVETSADHGNDISDLQEKYSRDDEMPLDPSTGTDPLDDETKANARDLEHRRPEGHFGEGNRIDDTGVTQSQEDEKGENAASEFGYLNYARDRAMFFWGDCLHLGLVTEDELAEWGFLEHVKLVPW